MIPQRVKNFLLVSATFTTLVIVAPRTTQSRVTSAEPLNIVFDLGNVMIEPSKLSAFWHVGPVKFLKYAALLNNPFNVRTRFFQFLNTIEPKDPNSITIVDELGQPLPFLIEARLKGLYSHEKLLERLEQEITKSGAFTNLIEQQLMRAIAHVIFDPDQSIKNQVLNPAGLALAQELKQQGHHLYILSNWDDSFPLLRAKYPEFFDLFDGVVVSHEVKHAKPEEKIYRAFTEITGKKPEECIFIDDQEVNLTKAKELGFNVILCPRKRASYKPLQTIPDYNYVRRELNKLVTLQNARAA